LYKKHIFVIDQRKHVACDEEIKLDSFTASNSEAFL